MLDGHVTGISENRTYKSTNKNYCFFTNDKKDDNLTEFIQNKAWFNDLLVLAHQSTYYGYSLIWFKDFDEKGEIKKVELIPRGLVIPEKNVLLEDFDAEHGLDYRELQGIVIYAQLYDHIGLLEKAATYTILKRHSWGSWDEFEEVFGVPIRIAKLATQSNKVKNEVYNWMEEMGRSSFGVFPMGTEIEIKENSKSDAFNVFYQKLNALDRELSKLFVHQTMTTDNGSSQSQAEVHQETYEELIKSDEKKLLSFLNDQLLPAMREIGYSIPEGARIGVELTVDPEAQIKIDSQLMSNGIVPTQNYIEETYGMEVDHITHTKNQATEGKD